MKSENNVLDYPIKDHLFRKKNSEVRKALNIRKDFDSEMSSNNPNYFFGCCLIDHSGKQFACVHEHCQRCFKSQAADDNHEFHALRFHNDDRQLWGEEVFPDILGFVDAIPHAELADYRLSFNHRFIHKSGATSEFLLEGTFSRAAINKPPVLNLKVFTELGDIKTDDTINLTIFRYSKNLGFEKVFSRAYGTVANQILSQREMEIIRLCLEGLSSKMIAEKLSLSIHTVKNHKRNCMEKTLTHNITELINKCIKSHWM